MKVFCDIIRDLLPLYAEDMVSEASKEMVREHLSQCPDCMERLNHIKQVQCVSVIAADADISSMERVGKAIRKRRRTTAVFAALMALTVAMGLYMFMSKRIYVSREDAVVQVIETEDSVEVKFSSKIANFAAMYVKWPESDKETVILVGYNTRWDQIINANRGREGHTFSCAREYMDRIFYANSNTGDWDVLLWGAPPDGFVTSLPRLAMHYYFLIALACGALMLIPAIILRRRKAGGVLRAGSAFFWCYALCSFLVAEGDWRVYDDVNFTVYFLCNVLLAVLLWMTLLTGSKLWKISRRDQVV